MPSIFLLALVLLFKIATSALLLTLGAHLFDFRRGLSILTVKRLISVFIFLTGLRVFHSALHFF